MLDDAVLAVGDFLVVFGLVPVRIILNLVQMIVQQVEQHQSEYVQLGAVRLSGYVIQFLEQRLFQFVHILLAAHDHVLNLLQFHLLGPFFHIFFHRGV